MRETLRALDGQRLTCRATVLRRGSHVGWAKVAVPTVCLGPITTPDGHQIADHVWLHVGKRLAALRPHVGDVLEFSGRVRPYKKHFVRSKPGLPARYALDYHLSFPTRIRRLSGPAGEVEP